jgi:CubicO group peptidase (beta-lactamase class C family)
VPVSLRLNETVINSFISDVHRAYELPSLGVSIVSGDETFYHTQHRPGSSIDSDSSIFFTGNISEVMVTTGIARLITLGNVKLHDPVVKHLSYFQLGNDSYKGITIYHLLTQTSGIPKHDAVWDLPYDGDDALERTTRSISGQEHEFSPGSKIMRSQYSFDILADLISKASGTSFEQFMHENVFSPLGMTSATYHLGTARERFVARPYVISDWLTYQRDSTMSYPKNREHAGSIGFHASTKDISIWMKVMLQNITIDGRPFFETGIHQALLSSQFKTGRHSSVGLAWEIIEDTQLILNKDHSIGGFCANLTLIPEKGIGIFVVSNTSENFNPGFVSHQMLSWLGGSDLPKIKKPVHPELSRKLAASKNLDSVFNLYQQLKENHSETYDLSEQSFSQFGINLVQRLHRVDDGIQVYNFIKEEFPESNYVHLNLAEAFLVKDDLSNAEQQLEIAKELCSNDVSSRAHLAYLIEMLSTKKEKKHNQISDFAEAGEYP